MKVLRVTRAENGKTITASTTDSIIKAHNRATGDKLKGGDIPLIVGGNPATAVELVETSDGYQMVVKLS
ncbi:hypothetical protein JCM19240_3985 [Vibrio maritimus]|uniref:Uncharacterized protein n=1 Tax=Vibrio maritimus TaxID=990268 RepID=A0A090THQ8_9VIBR|nr:hypothetical protein JCM19240_3985 [Vibrio maritimus]